MGFVVDGSPSAVSVCQRAQPRRLRVVVFVVVVVALFRWQAAHGIGWVGGRAAAVCDVFVLAGCWGGAVGCVVAVVARGLESGVRSVPGIRVPVVGLERRVAPASALVGWRLRW